MPLDVQKMVEKINEDMREYYAVKRRELFDRLGLAKSDPIRLKAFPGTFCCRCGYAWRRLTNKPKMCPRCKSKYWATARTNRQGLRPVQTKGAALDKERDPLNLNETKRSVYT